MSSTAMNDGKYRRDAADQSFDYMFKLLIIGNSSVGKTSFLFRYADNSFTSAFVSTVGIDFKVKTVFRQDKRVKLQIWVSGSVCLGAFQYIIIAPKLCTRYSTQRKRILRRFRTQKQRRKENTVKYHISCKQIEWWLLCHEVLHCSLAETNNVPRQDRSDDVRPRNSTSTWSGTITSDTYFCYLKITNLF